MGKCNRSALVLQNNASQKNKLRSDLLTERNSTTSKYKSNWRKTGISERTKQAKNGTNTHQGSSRAMSSQA
ncbi:hypothetical protein CDAR_476141 [Caerostris darwini]|uniref:Uncharacterized protein n=1 Tax=Caerostris darwini TaxID=1538125 RepID=A0AAV4W7E8_9ARAC|nr:hypothetical protein CDAR_476141 [Caerostris darwini]